MYQSETLLASLAVAGGGVFSTADAVAAGVHDVVLRRGVRDGSLVHLRRGWYAVPDARRTPEDSHALRVRAELASRGPALFATHDSALVVHRLPVSLNRLATVHLGRSAGRQTGRFSHATPTRETSCVLHRVPEAARHQARCVEPAFAVVQVGLCAGPREALVCADSALARELVSRDDLDRAVTAYRRTPGIAAVRIAVERADALSESPGESRLRFELVVLGYPIEVQYPVVAEGSRYRADLRIAGTRVLIEYDGLGKYDDPAELRRERAREAALRTAGWDVVRFGGDDLDRPDVIERRLDAALARARRAVLPL